MSRPLLPRTPATGVLLALGTAAVSGMSVFVNAQAVTAAPNPTAWTTAKNLVAAALLGLALLAATRVRSAAGLTRPSGPAEVIGLLAVGLLGGGLAFVMFFEGLARSTATEAAFLHKTMVVWVAVLAAAALHERVGWRHVAAVALLLTGQAALAGDVTAIGAGGGEVLVLGATLLWSGEVVLARRLLRRLSPLTLGAARLGIGLVGLVAWLAVTGRLGSLAGVDWGWALLTGALLATYVATWYAALARAQAVDVTAVLVAGALVTAALEGAFGAVPVRADLPGLVLVAAGVGFAVWAAGRAARPRPVEVESR